MPFAIDTKHNTNRVSTTKKQNKDKTLTNNARVMLH